MQRIEIHRKEIEEFRDLSSLTLRGGRFPSRIETEPCAASHLVGTTEVFCIPF